MAELTAPQQNRLLGQLANMLRATEGDIAAPEFLPRQLDVMGLVRQLMLPSAETVEKLSYGDPLFRMPQQSYIPITADREYLADVVGMAPMVPAASSGATRLTNEAADALVRAITRNPEATAPGVLEAAGQMAPLARMFKPEQAKKILPETKIVDESGNPQLMYHGTPKVFEDFDAGERGAIFATSDPKFASEFSGGEMTARYGNSPNVRPVYVDAKNPFDYENESHVDKIMEVLGKDDPDFFAGTTVGRQLKRRLEQGNWEEIESRDVQNAIKQLGFDGFYVYEGGGKNIAVFDPRQIKSAISDPQMAGLLDEPAQSVAEAPIQRAFTTVSPGDEVAGLTVREDVPNMSSIGATIENYEILQGIRKVPRKAFDEQYLNSLNPAKLDKRTADLSDQIKQSKEINPLIVAVDNQGAYIIEGGHRFDALMTQKRESVPAVVVIDKDNPPTEEFLQSLLD